jgi:hypothetical protein
VRWQPFRLLIAAVVGLALIDGCNGPGIGPVNGGGSGGSSGGGGPGLSTPGPFYVAGKANAASGSPELIGTFVGPASTDAYDLVVVDPAVTTVNQVAPAGTWVPMASVSQWTSAGSGMASNWGPRYLVYAQLPNGTSSQDAPLFILDLARTSSTKLPTTGARFSTASTLTSNLCAVGQGSGLVLNDYVTPSRSWVTLRTPGPDNNCGTVDNQTIAIPLSAGPNTEPTSLGLTEPVEAIHDTNGVLIGAIELMHILPTDIGTKAPTLQMTDGNLGVLGAIGTSQAMQGTGNTTSGGLGDFQSLGVTATSGVWLYRDASSVRAISLASPKTTYLLFTLAASTSTSGPDVLQSGRALFDSDGATAYVAVSNGSGTSYIVRIDTSVTPPTATTIVTETAVTSIQLLGLTSTTGELVYLTGGQTNTFQQLPTSIQAIATNASSTTVPLTVVSLGATQQPDTEPPAVVGDSVYYTIVDSSGGTTPYRQVYAATFGSGVVSAPSAITFSNGSCAVMVRPVYPNPVATTGTPPYASVLLASGANLCQSSDTALAYSGAMLISRDVTGNAATVGQLPQLTPQSNSGLALQWVDFGYFFGEPAVAPPIDSPLQSGLPVLLELVGSTSLSVPAADVETFLPGSTIGPIRLTKNLQ